MNTYSQKIPANKEKDIKSFFIKEGAVFDTVQYSLWRAKTSNFQAVYYKSGKLLIQGKDIDNIAVKIDNILGLKSDYNVVFPENSNIQRSLIDTNGEKYIGTDESGKGDLFGPLVIAGVQSDNINYRKFIDIGIKDSKKLDDSKILKMAGVIKANSVHSVVVITPRKYNELYAEFKNLNKLLAWGHARVIENILEKFPCNYALADKFGDDNLIKNALMKKGENIVLKQSVRAESDIIVAAASVLARAEFVKRMQELSNRYEINFSKGVSENVKSQTIEFIKKYSFERLNEIAKLHFKTVQEIKQRLV